jgi:hypothetical protein
MPAVARLPLVALAFSLLVACGSPAPESPEDAGDEASTREMDRDTEETVFDDMIETEDRARAVEDVTMDAKRNLDQAIDAQTGGQSDEAGGN